MLQLACHGLLASAIGPLYQVASAEGPDDTELVAHQIWLSTVISRIVNEMHPTEAADDFS